VVVALAALVAGGVALSTRGGDGDGRPDEPPPPSAPDDAYREAVARLGRARSFAYSGEVRAPGRSTLRPGTWLDDDVRVEGAVLLPLSISHEVATARDDGTGPVVETVSVGSTVWSRSAAGRAELDGGEWMRVAWTAPPGSPPRAPNPESLGSGRLGLALVPDLLRVAENRRPAPDDAEGHRVLAADVPTEAEHEARFGDLAGAAVTLTLDEAGDITDIVLAAGPDDGPDGDPDVVVELAIDRLADPAVIGADDLAGPVRSGVDPAGLAAAGVQPLEASALPRGWALVDAIHMDPVDPGSGMLCGTASGPQGCTPTPSCTELGLRYVDLTAVSGGELSLWMWSDDCVTGSLGDAATGAVDDERFEAGRFTGWVEEDDTLGTFGLVSDGETVIRFETDLSAADVAAVLENLVPYGAADGTGVLVDVPSS
jgi:hypothetical protein